jgi:BirA family transcriptional regulator, biotin operon repressor / biotin---[acetyl-CoA-carboxylase] ligase
MVNGRGSTRSLLLARLRRTEGYVRGTDFCDELGISRVAVWKQIDALKECGYRIESDRRGYRLSQDGDSIQAWEFPEFEDLLVHYDQTDSTMDRALSLALEGAGREWIVVAESQKNGRGRRGRSWKSDQGGLFCTLVLYPKIGIGEYLKPLLGAGVALCEAVRELTGEEATLEWPNDLFLGGKKIAGLLPEFLGSGEGLRFFDIGLGVNVDNRVAAGSQANLRSLSGKRVTRRDLLRLFIKGLEPFKESDFSQPDLAARWWGLCSSGGRTVVGEGGKKLGRARGVDSSGSILVETKDGRTMAYGVGSAAIADKEKKK